MKRASWLLTLLFLAGILPAQAQWTPERTVVLKGQVVTMNGNTPVREGLVVVRNGKIAGVLPPNGSYPADAIVIETKGFIYPGLMNLHDHIAYNFLKLYDLPKHTTNHDQWPGGKDYEREVNNPNNVMKNIYGYISEAQKYAEIRAIIGGTTTIQGEDTKGRGPIETTLVRNVSLGNFGVSDQELGVGQNALGFSGMDYKAFAADPSGWRSSKQRPKAFLLHLAEGTDQIARREYYDDHFDMHKAIETRTAARNLPGCGNEVLIDGQKVPFMVWPGLVAIHGTALNEGDFALWRRYLLAERPNDWWWARSAQSRPKVVWSPTSNFLLYGKTTDIAAAKKAGALIGLGTDWAPSGTKNMLWELKVVEQVNQASNPKIFSSRREIVELATVNGARILGWDNKVGRIRNGMFADLLVVDAIPGAEDAYHNLILATEQHVQLVFVGGDPLYGDKGHLDRLKVYNGQPRYELLPELGSARPKGIDMLQDPAKSTMSVAEVKAKLEESLRLDPAEMAARANENEKARQLINDRLERPANTPITAEDAQRYLKSKFPNLRPIAELETLVTDEAFFRDLESNVHWRDPSYGVADLMNLRQYFKPSDSTGLNVVVDSLNDGQ